MSSGAAHPTPESFPPLTPAVFHILLALADGEKHGYAIMREVEEETAGAVRMGAGTLYGSLDRMIGAGLIEEAPNRGKNADPRRRYYRMSDLGQRVARQEADRLAKAVRTAKAKRLFLPA